jgi:hypothetical protein
MKEYLTKFYEYDLTNICTFNEYTKLCNYSSDSARKIGILSEEAYLSCVHDSRTVFISIGEDNKRIPLMAHIDHGPSLGFNVERCLKEAESTSDNVYTWLLPPIQNFIDLNHDFREDINDNILSTFEGTIFFTDNNEKNQENEFYLIFDQCDIEINNIQDNSAPDGHQLPTLSLYQINTEPTRGVCKKKVDISDFIQYQKLGLHQGIEIFKGSQVNDEDSEMLWNLYKKRFQWLGKNHIISMEDSIDEFMSLIKYDECLIFLKRHNDNTPACFTYIHFDFNRLYWLNNNIFNRIAAEADDNQVIMFFPGIVSDRSGTGYSYDVLKTIADIGDKVNMRAIVLFEDTNISELYVPKIVRSALNDRPYKNIISDKEVEHSKTFYKAIHLRKK